MTLHSGYRADAVPAGGTLVAKVDDGHLYIAIASAPGNPNAAGWLVRPPGWPDAVVAMDMDGLDGGREEADQRLFPDFNRVTPWGVTSEGMEATVKVRSHEEQVNGAPSHKEEYMH